MRACVRACACVRVCVRECVSACVRVCVCVCVCVCVFEDEGGVLTVPTWIVSCRQHVLGPYEMRACVWWGWGEEGRGARAGANRDSILSRKTRVSVLKALGYCVCVWGGGGGGARGGAVARGVCIL